MTTHKNEFYIRGEKTDGLPYAFTTDCKWVLAEATGDKSGWAKFPSYESAAYVLSALPALTKQPFKFVRVGLV